MPSLIIDYKIDKIIKQLQQKVKDVNGKELSYDTIVGILSSQIDATIEGMAHGHTVVWKRLGNFVATKRRVDALNKSYVTRGKSPTLVDAGFSNVRLSFNRKGEQTGETNIETCSKKDNLDIPDKYKP